jgi:hypothetical protein
MAGKSPLMVVRNIGKPFEKPMGISGSLYRPDI